MSMSMKPVLRKVPDVKQVAVAPAKRRLKVWINPRFQWSILGWMWATCGGVVTVFYVGVRYFFWKFEKLGIEAGLQQGHEIFQFLAEQNDQMNRIFLGTSVGAFVFLTVIGILVSHRVAGPVLRVRNHMDRLSDGMTPDDLQFRENDYFPELASSVNAFALKYKKALKKAQARRFIS